MRKLTKDFVLAADEVWRLQGGFDAQKWRAAGGTDRECIAFQKIAAEGHYGPGAGSKQGIYVCTPAGKLLASINSNRARSVARTLRSGLRRWQKLKPTEQAAAAADATPAYRPDWALPKNGLALTSTVRYLPESGDPKAPRQREYNHDACWFDRSEARRWLPAAIKLGATTQLPPNLFNRLARFNLVDAVRGETRPNQKVSGTLRSKVRGFTSGVGPDRALIVFEGTIRAENEPRTRGLYRALGIDAKIRGTAEWDLEKGQFENFRMVAIGVRWAQSRRRRGRAGTRESRRIGWLFELTPKTADPVRVAPTHLGSYGVDWATRDQR